MMLPDSLALERAAELIRAASRPVVIAGAQWASPGDDGWLRAFVEALPAPVLATAGAKGLLPEAHPLALGIFTGAERDEAVLGLADLIIACGLSPQELDSPGWPHAAPVVRFAGPACSGLPFTPRVELLGDLPLILAELAPRLRGRTQADWDMFQIDRLKKARGG